MKKLGIRSIVVKKYRPHSTKKVYEGGENLLNRDFTTTKINEKWVADITYIHTGYILSIKGIRQCHNYTETAQGLNHTFG